MKKKTLVHGHVKVLLNFVTFDLKVLIKIVRVIKNIFFETGLIINSKSPVKKREQLRMIRLYCS